MGLRRVAASMTAIACVALSACGGSDDEPSRVGAGAAYTAIIRWEAAERPPVPGSDGSSRLPVIYVASALGDSIDAGTQAGVADATKDDAVVRFTDRREDVVDMDDERQPVKDDDVMLLVGPLPEPARVIEVEVLRYRSLEDQTKFVVEITSSRDGARVTSATEASR